MVRMPTDQFEKKKVKQWEQTLHQRPHRDDKQAHTPHQSLEKKLRLERQRIQKI